MNLTCIERKKINRVSNKNKDKNKDFDTNNDKKVKNIHIRKIEPKKFGMKSIIGGIGGQANGIKSHVSNTISLSSKLSDISEKLEKYENLINKLGTEFQ